jgi:hypothetical protein
MSIRAVLIATCVVLLVGSGCGGAGYASNGRQLPPESCPDVESLASCAARLESLNAALAEALPPPPAAPQEQVVEQSAPVAQMEAAAPERDAEEEQRRFHDRKGGPDCSAARDLRDRICDLADAICALAARAGAPHEIMDRCTSARASCERARSEVSNACPS